MNTTPRFLLGVLTVAAGLAVGFAHHAIYLAQFPVSHRDIPGLFIAPLLALTAALVLGALVYRRDVDPGYFGRAAGWYLGTATVFGLAAYFTVTRRHGVTELSPSIRLTLANWTIGGSVIGLLLANYDLRRFWALGRAREQAAESRRLARRVSVLNRVLRHDIRNKVNVIIGQAQLLATDDNQEAVSTITDAAETLTELADRARRVQQVVESQSIQPVELGELVIDAVDDLHAEYPTAQVTTDIPRPTTVLTYPIIRSVLGDLLENAIFYNDRPEDECTVSVSIHTVATEADLRELRIEDNGPGSPERELVVLEETGETQLTHSRGTSLWMARWLAEESQGAFTIDTSPEGGTRVVLRLPGVDVDPNP